MSPTIPRIGGDAQRASWPADFLKCGNRHAYPLWTSDLVAPAAGWGRFMRSTTAPYSVLEELFGSAAGQVDALQQAVVAGHEQRFAALCSDDVVNDRSRLGESDVAEGDVAVEEFSGRRIADAAAGNRILGLLEFLVFLGDRSLFGGSPGTGMPNSYGVRLRKGLTTVTPS
jgi:hypothetical protein